jgi:UDP-galactose transporter B1
MLHTHALSHSTQQWFLLLCIFRFDSLTLTTITTTRKFFTIITNVFVYHHVVSPLQWVGVVCVFGGLAMDMLDKQREKKKKEKKTA